MEKPPGNLQHSGRQPGNVVKERHAGTAEDPPRRSLGFMCGQQATLPCECTASLEASGTQSRPRHTLRWRRVCTSPLPQWGMAMVSGFVLAPRGRPWLLWLLGSGFLLSHGLLAEGMAEGAPMGPPKGDLHLAGFSRNCAPSLFK